MVAELKTIHATVSADGVVTTEKPIWEPCKAVITLLVDEKIPNAVTLAAMDEPTDDLPRYSAKSKFLAATTFPPPARHLTINSPMRWLVFFLLATAFLRADAMAAGVHWEAVPLVNQGIRDRGFTGGEGGQQLLSIGAAEDGSLFLFGTDVGGLFRSFDGVNWEPANIGMKARGAYAIAIDPWTSDNILVLGGSKTDADHNTTGVYLSRDRALTWTHVRWEGRETDDVQCLVFDPSTRLPDGRSQRAYYSSPASGLYRSDNSGQTWAQTSTDLTYAKSHLGVNRSTGRLYLGNATGFYTSDDFGVTFTRRRTNPVGGISTPSPGVVYITEGQTIQVSTNSGATFTPVSTSTGFAFQAGDTLTFIAVNPQDTQQILVNRARGQYYDNRAFSTRNGGTNWSQTSLNHQNAFLPYNGRPTSFVWAGGEAWAEGGDWITRSTDGGATFGWSANGYNGIMVTGLSFSPTNPEVVMVSTQDYDSSLSTNDGRTWSYLGVSGNNWGGFLYGAHASEAGLRFGGNAPYWNGPRTLHVFRNGSWTNTGLLFSGNDFCYSAPGDSQTLFASNWRSDNGGATWTDMKGDAYPVKCDGVFTHDAASGTLFGMARITGGSRLVRSTDKGATWSVVATLSNKLILDCAYDHVRRRAWIIAESFSDNQTRDLMFTTLDANGVGTTPALASPYPPSDTVWPTDRARINSVAVDPVDPQIIYIGSSRDIFRADNSAMRSLDGGATWENLTLRAAPAAGRSQGPSEVSLIRVHPSNRFAWFGTSCYGIWKLAPPNFVPAAASTPINVTLPAGVSISRPLTVTNATGSSQTFRFTLPAAHGYEVKTSTEAGGPTYSWTDLTTLSGTTTLTELSNQNDVTSQYVNGASSATGAIPLGLTFPLFGENHTGLWVSTNGTLHFGSRPGTSRAANVALPATSFGATVFVLWDDLRFYNSPTPASQAYFRQTAPGTFVVQYSNVRQNGNTGAMITCQAQLSTSGDITLVYKDLTLLANSTYTIGAQNSDRSRFHQFSHNTASVGPGFAVRFRPQPEWALPLSASLDLAAGAVQNHILTISSTGRPPGTYTTTLTVQTLSGALPAVSIPVTLTVRADTALEAWRRTHFGQPLSVGDSSDLADPEGDGLPNLIEYALGTDPLAPSAQPPVQSQISNSKLQITFPRARTGLTYEVLASSDLVTWTVIATNPGTVGQTATVIDTVDVSTNSRRFHRLRVTQ